MAENVHDMDDEPEKVFRGWLYADGVEGNSDSENLRKLERILGDKKSDEILRKFVILSILKGLHL